MLNNYYIKWFDSYSNVTIIRYFYYIFAFIILRIWITNSIFFLIWKSNLIYDNTSWSKKHIWCYWNSHIRWSWYSSNINRIFLTTVLTWMRLHNSTNFMGIYFNKRWTTWWWKGMSILIYSTLTSFIFYWKIYEWIKCSGSQKTGTRTN